MKLEQTLREEIGQLVGMVETLAPEILAPRKSWFCRVRSYFSGLAV